MGLGLFHTAAALILLRLSEKAPIGVRIRSIQKARRYLHRSAEKCKRTGGQGGGGGWSDKGANHIGYPDPCTGNSKNSPK